MSRFEFYSFMVGFSIVLGIASESLAVGVGGCAFTLISAGFDFLWGTDGD